MRRLSFAAAVCGTLVLAACSDQRPTEPVVPPPSENLGSCQPTPFPLAGTNGIAQQIANIYPGTSKAQTLLRAQALAQAAAIKLLWDTCHPAAAKKAAFIFIDWLNRHTPVGKETQVQNLIVAVLRGVGEITGAPADGDFGVGFFDPANPNPTVITTVNHHALVQLDPGSFLVPTEIVVSRKAGDPDLTNFDGNQFPPTYDYNAINSTNTHVLQPGKTAKIAFCLVIIGGPETPGNGYPDPANLAIGHNPVAGAPGFPFEILEPFDLEGTPLRNSLTCPGIDDVIGSAGGGLQDFANAALHTAGRFLLPQPLWAATLGTLPPPPPRTGKAGSLSLFKPVEHFTDQLQIFGDPDRDIGGDFTGFIFFSSTGLFPLKWGCDEVGEFCNYPTVRLLDSAGNPVAGVDVSVTLVGDNGAFTAGDGGSTTSVTTDADGLAVFDNLIIQGIDGNFNLIFSAPGATPITSGQFSLSIIGT